MDLSFEYQLTMGRHRGAGPEPNGPSCLPTDLDRSLEKASEPDQFIGWTPLCDFVPYCFGYSRSYGAEVGGRGGGNGNPDSC